MLVSPGGEYSMTSRPESGTAIFDERSGRDITGDLTDATAIDVRWADPDPFWIAGARGDALLGVVQRDVGRISKGANGPGVVALSLQKRAIERYIKGEFVAQSMDGRTLIVHAEGGLYVEHIGE
jgi:hypothetical protein